VAKAAVAKAAVAKAAVAKAAVASPKVDKDTAAQGAATATAAAPTATEDPNTVDANWRETTDKTSGRVYFYNKVTKKTSWKVLPAHNHRAEVPCLTRLRCSRSGPKERHFPGSKRCQLRRGGKHGRGRRGGEDQLRRAQNSTGVRGR